MKKTSDLIPPLLLEQYVLEELDEADRQKIDELRKGNLELEQRINDLLASNKEILERYPPELMKARLSQRTVPARTRRGRWNGVIVRGPIIGAVAAASALVFFFWFTPFFRPEPTLVMRDTDDAVRMKGDIQKIVPAITLYRKLDAEQPASPRGEILADRAVVREGDLVQVRYFAAQKKYGIIFSIDGRGSVTLHYPAGRNASTALEPAKEIFLPESFKLDNAPRFERFFFVTSETTISVATVLEKAAVFAEDPVKAMTGFLPLPPEMTQTVITLLKENK